MTDLTLLLDDNFELKKIYVIPTLERIVDYITVELKENSSLSSNISEYTFTLIIELPSGAKAAYTLVPDTSTKFEKFAVPTAFSNFGKKTKVYITVYNGETLVDKSTELVYELQNFYSLAPTLQITENGTYDVSNFEKVIVNAGSPLNLEDFFARNLTDLELQVPTIGDYMFYNNTVLQSFTDTELTELGKYAFYNNTALTSFAASNSLGKIKEYTFYDCQELQTIDLSNIDEIEQYALYNCQKFNGNTLGASKIGQYGGYKLGKNSTAGFIYNPSTPAKIENHGLRISGITEIKGKIAKIGDYAFAELPKLSAVNAEIIGPIGEGAFLGDIYVKNADFSSCVINSIGKNAFIGFGSDRANYSTDPHMFMDFRNSTFNILRESVFSQTKYTDFYFPESVNQIDNKAFQYIQYSNLFFSGKAPTLSSTNAFGSASNYKIYAPWKYLKSYVSGTNWAALASNIIGYATASTFTAGDTLPEYNAEGYALTWYSDEAKTTEVTTCPEGSPALYCDVGATKEKQIILITTSGPISITVTDGDSNPVDIRFGYIACDDEDVFNISAATSETGYTYYINVDGTRISIPYELTMSTDDVSIRGVAYDPAAINQNFEEASWRELKNAVETGVATTLYANDIGKSKEILLKNEQTIQLRLVNNTDNLYEKSGSSGSTGFVLEFIEGFNLYKMNSTATADGGWNASYMRTTVMPLIKALFPDELKDVLATVKRVSVQSKDDRTLVTSNDDLFLPFEREIFASSICSCTEEWNTNTRWQYYVRNDNKSARVKKYNGSNKESWLASLSMYSSQSFSMIYTDGSGTSGAANGLYATTPALAL